MNICPNCRNKIEIENNFCKYCGTNLNEYIIDDVNTIQQNNKDSLVPAIIFTIIYLLIYVFNWFVWAYLSTASTGGELVLNLRNIYAVSIVSMMFSFVPCLTAVILSFRSKKNLLIIFNFLFLVIHIIMFFTEDLLIH